ncbi:hypothetical protein N0V83_007054 [Neocucurbitaria cava]|uniref:NFX1-type zinc finger-containing protein 1 n=1 Tax=Neocucurbitaria cava TaxID=798079 RepID=A0A9W9CKW7_9PLEO|nr:hypothetical protein N0V83_007054 [Neocucurbitaria cava]
MAGRNGDRGRGRGQRGGRGRGARTQGPNPPICFKFRDTGACNRTDCSFSHDLSSTGTTRQTGQRRTTPARAKETEEQEAARTNYSNLKRLIGADYEPNDTYNMTRVWKGAVAILQEDDRDWKQQLPRDLDDSIAKCNGRAHIKAIVEKRATSSDSETFLEIVKDFLTVITHPSLLDCLAVDTYVGGIYNFISGVNGGRAISFFQHLCETLVAVKTKGVSSISEKMLEQSLIALSSALYEVLRRDQRARLNDRLDALVCSLESASEIFSGEMRSITSTVVNRDLAGIRSMIARAEGLVTEEGSQDFQQTDRFAAASAYPRDVVIPQDRHDNDKMDIAEITIFPTRDEIMSDAKDFLPSTDPDQPHFLTNPVERHIDTNFRLFRHDIFGDQKKALSGLMHAATEEPTVLRNPRIDLGEMRAHSYTNAHVSYVSFKTRHGLEVQMTFLQPPQVRKRSTLERYTWWEESRRLDAGSLLSFIWVQNSIVEHIFLTVTNKSTAIDDQYGLTNNDTMAWITTKLSTHNSRSMQLLLRANLHRLRGVLLEFPSTIPATFVPILDSLQSMQRLSRLPFHQWILPDQHGGPPEIRVYHDIPPPLYARQAGFTFPLRSIMKTKADSLVVEPTSSCDDDALIEEIMKSTELDRGQCKALIAALTREFVFIQGPPGTGKSYLGLQVMKILLDIRKKGDLGPIIVVCYTNHALDQFLEHIMKAGFRKVIRVGGQSKSDMLEGHNLRDITQTEGKTKPESWQSAMAYKALEECARDAKAILGRLRNTKHGEWQALRKHILQKYRPIYEQFKETDDEGFTMSGRHPFDIWKPTKGPTGPEASTSQEVITRLMKKAAGDVHSLTHDERCALIFFWVEEIRFDQVAQLSGTVSEASDEQARLTRIHDEADRRVLEGADVIGVTTSGLAKRISVLQHIRCKVMICEEAGEVMEPHMLSALLPTVEHCIQIGDHEQLRPSINNFKELSLESKQGALHSLDRTQFERLSVGERGRPLMPVAQLEVQRLKAGTRNYLSSTDRPFVYDWTTGRGRKSKSNPWEVGMVHSLVRHIVRQGVYQSSDIAVLTPYTGQLQKIRIAMRNDFEIVLSDRDKDALEKDGFSAEATPSKMEAPLKQQPHRRRPLEKKKLSDLLRVATVDNFQGEEAKIIIVSLVRSNNEERVGFLKTSNRINVLLSRAQHGMYLIGNTETYASVSMWRKVIDMIRASDSVGESLGLCCPKHPEKIIEVQQPDDFIQLSPEGGCQEACTERLIDCGHQCQARCHSTAMHNVFRCEKPCQRRHHHCDHPCQKATCGEDCGKCMIKINNVQLPCGHMKDDVLCYKTLDIASIKCEVDVPRQVPGCQHDVKVKCFLEVNKEGFMSVARCGCPSICAEDCPVDYCQECGMQQDNVPDLIMGTQYSDINLDETPIVVLGCGHFFTVETLDGVVGLSEVYQTDAKSGLFVALTENSQLVTALPQCPTCRCPIRQFATQRYNRLINRAVIDQMSKRFIVSGQQELQMLENKLRALESKFENTRKVLLASTIIPSEAKAAELCGKDFNKKITNRYKYAIDVTNDIKSLQHRMAAQHQPVQKLRQAIVHAITRNPSLDEALAALKIERSATSAKRECDVRITLGARLLEIKARCLVLEDKFDIERAVKLKAPTSAMYLSSHGGSPFKQSGGFLNDCMKLIDDCVNESLPKLAVETTLYYARIVQALPRSGDSKDNKREKMMGYRSTAKDLLKKAERLCEHSFRNRNVLLEAIMSAEKLLDDERYEEVTKEEIQAIKKAMVSGRGGIATHSGHWYNCVNGHPFAVGECGMPMQLARCPECGEPVGGQNHVPVGGVSRAENMEQ